LHLGNGIVEIRAHHNELVGIAHHGQVYLTPNHHEYDTRFYMEWYGIRLLLELAIMDDTLALTTMVILILIMY